LKFHAAPLVVKFFPIPGSASEWDNSKMLALNRSPWTYRIGLPVFHLAAVAGLLTAPPTAKALIVGAVLYVFRGFGITVGYHRYFTHESFRTSRPVAFFLALGGGLAGQGTASWWTYRHRMHHRYTDRVGDPHSPKIDGFFHAHIGWLFRRSTPDAWDGENALRNEWPIELRLLDRWIPMLFFGQGIVLYAIGGWTMVTWAYFVPTVLSWHLTFLVNSLCHVMGERPFDTADDSRNNLFFAAVMFGEGWHNNHHAWPKNAKLGLRPLQIDLGYYLIKSLEVTGLAWDLSVKSEEEIRNSVRRYAKLEATG
jgi:stearoyl-CoA desaturase (delta-9 desaturase)